MNAPVLELTYKNLPAELWSAITPAEVPDPRVLLLNRDLAPALGLDRDWLESDAALKLFSGQGGAPVAMAYSGHQFGHLSPLLGDGRAALVGEIVGPDGTRFDLHLKGSGPTPYSRRGDGFSTLRAALKEYVFTEALSALGIPCSRSLAVVTTGNRVRREAMHPGAILTRVARSHVRVGTFQFAALQQDRSMLQALADFVMAREYPDLAAGGESRYLQLFRAITDRQASLIATWMAHGFIHGVMNTDNMAVSGETIDFGPCAFMDSFNPARVFSSIDAYGRYAWNRQADIGVWNLSRLAEAMLPLLADEPAMAVKNAEQVLESFPDVFNARFNRILGSKIGLETADRELLRSMLSMLQQAGMDYTLFFRELAAVARGEGSAGLQALATDPAPLLQWLSTWEQALPADPGSRAAIAVRMDSINPLYIPRNWLLEQALDEANAGKLQTFERLLSAVQNPFRAAPEFAGLEQPPPAGQPPLPTFCET
jgi:uncharacterized protein YdiU (UPF0061 family)